MSSHSESDDDSHFWSRSPSPEEDFTNAPGANADGSWSYEFTGRYEVGYGGEIIHEVDWSPWEREDGSSTTYDNDLLVDEPGAIDRQNEKLAAKRLSDARESAMVLIGSHTDPLYTATWELDQAVEEKLRLWARTEDDSAAISDSDEDVPRQPSPAPAPPSPRRSVSQPSSATLVGSSRSSTRHAASRSHTGGSTTMAGSAAPQASRTPNTSQTPSRSESSSALPAPRPTRPLPRRAHMSASAAATPEPSRSSRAVSSSRNKGKGKARETLESILRDQVEEELDRTGAADLTFMNGLDLGPTEDLPNDFVYKEQGYELGPGIDESSSDFLTFCNCDAEGLVCHPRYCKCHTISEAFRSASGKPIFAYGKGKKYAFPDVDGSFEVVECNQKCTCDSTCKNRVAQLPRSVPLQIFRTQNRGWGVRSPIPLKAGTVIGTFSGKREDADDLPAEQRSYCLDLGGKEKHIDSDGVGLYTVNSWGIGAFVSAQELFPPFQLSAHIHSCQPNLATYSVVWDTVPEENRPYIAFVAVVDIRAYTEFTLDYHPDFVLESGDKKSKRRKKDKDLIQCECGSDHCRKWIPGA
ncbi:hypothetical protein HDZ31DRAFT_34851 [Schizophyllum fasciatum]